MDLSELENQTPSLNKLGWGYASLPLKLIWTTILLSMRGGIVLSIQTRKG